MNWVALQMLTGDKAKYLGLIFTIAFSSFLIAQQVSIFAGIMNRTRSQIPDVNDADIWVMDPATQYFDEVYSLKDSDVDRVRGVLLAQSQTNVTTDLIALYGALGGGGRFRRQRVYNGVGTQMFPVASYALGLATYEGSRRKETHRRLARTFISPNKLLREPEKN
jgi:hypothetical protein